jgi:hypothetical protein
VNNRAVAVGGRARIEGMQKVDHLDRIVGEIQAAGWMIMRVRLHALAKAR